MDNVSLNYTECYVGIFLKMSLLPQRPSSAVQRCSVYLGSLVNASEMSLVSFQCHWCHSHFLIPHAFYRNQLISKFQYIFLFFCWNPFIRWCRNVDQQTCSFLFRCMIPGLLHIVLLLLLTFIF